MSSEDDALNGQRPAASRKRLVLFDIDGTLLWGGPLWKECFLGALAHCHPELTFPVIPFGGKTDVQICRELMAEGGFTPERIDAEMSRVVEEYLRRATVAAATRASEVTVLPGVREILEELSRASEVILGLLTGNVRAGARAKLACVGLDSYFPFGVFGDDHWDRYRLPQLAVDRARERTGLSFSGKQIVIVGDTIHDVNCGKSLGARSIAVGTGKNVPLEELLAQNPDYYFHDLSETSEVLTAILEEI